MYTLDKHMYIYIYMHTLCFCINDVRPTSWPSLSLFLSQFVHRHLNDQLLNSFNRPRGPLWQSNLKVLDTSQSVQVIYPLRHVSNPNMVYGWKHWHPSVHTKKKKLVSLDVHLRQTPKMEKTLTPIHVPFNHHSWWLNSWIPDILNHHLDPFSPLYK